VLESHSLFAGIIANVLHYVHPSHSNAAVYHILQGTLTAQKPNGFCGAKMESVYAHIVPSQTIVLTRFRQVRPAGRLRH